MAALAAPLLEAAGTALLRAVLVALGGAAAHEALKKREESVDNAKSLPIAKTESRATTKTCSKCPPDCGTLVERNWNMSEESREYQARITGFAPGTEWNFEGVDFDGFYSGMCMLQEAKARYDQFFDKDGLPYRWYRGFEAMRDQAFAQSQIARASPPSLLRWSFMTPLTFAYMEPALLKMPPLIPIYQP